MDIEVSCSLCFAKGEVALADFGHGGLKSDVLGMDIAFEVESRILLCDDALNTIIQPQVSSNEWLGCCPLSLNMDRSLRPMARVWCPLRAVLSACLKFARLMK